MSSVSIYTLASGSSGNCTYLKLGEAEFLIDAGVSRREIARKLAELGTSLDKIAAIFVTHEHSDHIKGIEMIAKYDRIPIFGAKPSLSVMTRVDPTLLHPIRQNESVTLKDATITPFKTWHDSLASYGYVASYEGLSFGYCTDLGRPSDEVTDALVGCRAVILEANYDSDMLKYGDYPPFLKSRIAGEFGHLSNDVSAKFAAFLAKCGTERILLAHLSKENNTPEKAYTAVSEYLKKESLAPSLSVADRYGITELITISC